MCETFIMLKNSNTKIFHYKTIGAAKTFVQMQDLKFNYELKN